jgi:hypothetical protein
MKTLLTHMTAKCEQYGEDVVNFLSKNSALHIYKETAEERLVVALKKLIAAQKSGTAAYTSALEEIQNSARKTNSMQSGVWNAKDLVEFYLSLVGLGEPFTTMSCIQLTWANDTFRNVYGGLLNAYVQHLLTRFKFLFSATAFPPLAEITALQTAWVQASGDEKEELGKKLRDVGEDLGTDLQPQMQLVTPALLQEMDGVFTTNLGALSKWFGSSVDEYYGAFLNYVDGITSIVERLGRPEDFKNVKEQQVITHIAAKVKYLFHSTSYEFVGYLPFVTPSSVPLMKEWLDQTKMSIAEVSFKSRITMINEVRDDVETMTVT